MKHLKILGALLTIILFASCKDISVYDKYHNSVVMIYHKYLYQATINGENLYFNYNEDTKRFTNIKADIKEAETNAMANYGTGFFISDDGMIATNRHVVYNLNEEIKDKAKRFFRYVADNRELYYDSLKNNSTFQINAWTNKYYKSYWQDDKNKAYKEIKAWKKLQSGYAKKVIYWERIKSSLINAKFSVKTIYLGYALDGSFAKRITDFQECQLIKYSKEEDIDLAVIQSNEGRLPDGVRNYIKLEDIPAAPLKVGDEVSMLGYNLGPKISSTTTGLKVQNTTGKVSQESNGTRILYSINALPGSSGSPVFSEDGKLVAINYYGYVSQAFNYGILAKHLASLVP